MAFFRVVDTFSFPLSNFWRFYEIPRHFRASHSTGYACVWNGSE